MPSARILDRRLEFVQRLAPGGLPLRIIVWQDLQCRKLRHVSRNRGKIDILASRTPESRAQKSLLRRFAGDVIDQCTSGVEVWRALDDRSSFGEHCRAVSRIYHLYWRPVMGPEIAGIFEGNPERILAAAIAVEYQGRTIEYLRVGEKGRELGPGGIVITPESEQRSRADIRGSRVGWIRVSNLALPFRVKQILPCLGAAGGVDRLRVLIDRQNVQVRTDPQIVWIAIASRSFAA